MDKSLLDDMKRIFGLDENNQQSPEHLLKNVIHYYETIVGCMPGNVYWLDKEGRTVGCNQNVLSMLGLRSIEQFKGLSFDEMGKIGRWTREAIEAFKKDTLEVIKTGIPKLNIEEPSIPHSDGRFIYFLTHRVPLFDSNKNVIGVVGISLDITQRKQLENALMEAKERAETANLAKTEFLENMRHDIRTPLTGIVGFADLIKMEVQSPSMKEYVENLVISSHALLKLLDEVLEAIHVSSGEIPLLKKKFNLKQTLQHVIDLNRAKATQKKLSLTFHIDDNIPQYVIGDKVRLHRITLELIANALNFTEVGFVHLALSLAQEDEKKLIVKLLVEDSGIGIAKEMQQEIYVQFKRLTPSYQGIYKGSGLGLTVIKQFINELEGEIYVESEPRKGSRFTCLIPLQKPLIQDDFGVDDLEKSIDLPHETALAQQAEPVINQPQTAQFTVLLVEDNTIAQLAAKSILTQLHCNTVIAETGKQALTYWKKGHFDMVLMDIGLPDLDGYEVTRQMRTHKLPQKTQPPIIALTAHSGEENKKRCLNAGMNAVLTKPLTVKNCMDILDTFIPSYLPKV